MFDSFTAREAIRYAEKFSLGAQVRELIYKMGYAPSDALEYFAIS